jgi:predicted nucleic-acid-binding protein
MIGLDTNVLVRHIMQADAKQASKATKFMEALTVDVPGFVSQISIDVRHAIAWRTTLGRAMTGR